jgi:hypothetical protein
MSEQQENEDLGVLYMYRWVPLLLEDTIFKILGTHILGNCEIIERKEIYMTFYSMLSFGLLNMTDIWGFLYDLKKCRAGSMVLCCYQSLL